MPRGYETALIFVQVEEEWIDRRADLLGVRSIGEQQMRGEVSMAMILHAVREIGHVGSVRGGENAVEIFFHRDDVDVIP